jgi:hypothetical protein
VNIAPVITPRPVAVHKLLVLLALALCAGCGVSWYVGANPAAAAAPLDATAPTSTTAPTVTGRRLGGVYDAGFQVGNGATFYTSGTSGTVTVPAGAYVTGIYCHGSTDAGSGSLTITPAGPAITDAQAGPAIPVPAGQPITIARPWLQGSPNELGVGSVIVFSGTDAYFVTFLAYGGT